MSNPSRPVSGFVPLGDVIAGVELPDGRALPRPAPSQARHHFTQLDQVMQLVGASEADPELGFMARLLALCSLPRTDPKQRLQYVRHNGPYSLHMTATGSAKLPYGNIPRLLLAWVCTEAVRTQSRELVLGASISAFMRELGLDSSSGAGRRRLRDQMDRLFNATVSLTYEHEHGKQFVASRIADRGELWWDTKHPDQSSLWESTIRLGEEFFNEIIAHPVPLDMNILKTMKRSSLGLDLYLWITYRTFSLQRPMRLSWPRLYRQFGSNPAKASDTRTVDAFRTDCLRELKKIKGAWPSLHYSTAKGVLMLSPSPPRIPPSQLRLVE